MKRLIPAVIVLALLGGCSADPLAAQYESGSDKNYVSGDGTITVIASDDRGDPVAFESTTDSGEPVSNADYEGQVLVLNFWFSACPPCRVEAPDLEALHQNFDGEGAAFLGVNVRDQAETAQQFVRDFGITYPTVIDTNDGAILFAFAGTVAPNAVPTTLVIDKQGRVAARILGLIEEPSTLKSIIAEAIAE